MRQIPLAIGPSRLHTFDRYVPGANDVALRHLRALAARLPQDGAQAVAPVYLWGPSGSGKTHLLHALVHEAHASGQRAGWFDADSAPPWAFDAGWSLLVLDGCEAYSPAQQQAAFALFIEAGAHATQVAAAGTLPPVDLPLRDDLRSRLGWGPVFALEPLAESDARAALRREADHRGIPLSDDVMDYLLTRFSRDLRHLMGLLDRLDEFSLAQRRAVTVRLLKRMFEEEGQTL